VKAAYTSDFSTVVDSYATRFNFCYTNTIESQRIEGPNMKESYLGVHVSPLTYEGIVTEIKSRLSQGQQSTIIAVNPEKVMAAEKDPEVKNLINNSTFQIADGVGILLASKLKKGNIQSRVTGVDMMARLLKFAADDNHPIYLYGAKKEVVELAATNIKRDSRDFFLGCFLICFTS